jgi:hypothetical protein
MIAFNAGVSCGLSASRVRHLGNYMAAENINALQQAILLGDEAKVP